MRTLIINLFIISLFLTGLFSCSEKEKSKDISKVNLHLLSNGVDTLYMSDSSYTARLLPYILNLSDDTLYFISSIYGRANVKGRNIYPEFGYTLYKNGKEVEFSQFAVCGNYGNLDPKYFVRLLTNELMLPFKKQVTQSLNFEDGFTFRTSVRGEIEIEAYYNTSDTTQQKYHPFTNGEMKMNLAIQEYQSCRPYFLKTAHVNLKSKRIRFYLK